VADRKPKANSYADDSPTGPTIREPGDGFTPAKETTAFRGTLDRGLGERIVVENGRRPAPSFDIVKHQE
jgi:hypothetical protein